MFTIRNICKYDDYKNFKTDHFDERIFIHQKKGLLQATRKVKILSLPETIKEKSTFRAKALRRELVETNSQRRPSLETSIFPLSFQVVREPLPFAYHCLHYLHWQR